MSSIARIDLSGRSPAAAHQPAESEPAPPTASPRSAAPSPVPRASLRLRHRLIELGSLLTCLFAWYWLSKHRVNLGQISFVNVPGPDEVLVAAGGLLSSPKLRLHLLSSLGRAFGGFALAAVFGVVGGIAIARSRFAKSMLTPPLEIIRPIPGVAWIPLSILIFKSSEVSMIYITFLGALFPILINTIHGVDSIDRRYIQAAQSLGARPLHLLLHVVIHGALPSIITGLSLGMGTSWFCLITAEMIAGQYGIGYYTWESYNLQRYPEIVLGMLLIGVLGAVSSALVKRLGGLLIPWYRIQVGRHD